MSDERDAERLETGGRDRRDLVHARVSGGEEVLRVALHLDARQPVLDAGQLGQVWHVGVEEQARPERNEPSVKGYQGTTPS